MKYYLYIVTIYSILTLVFKTGFITSRIKHDNEYKIVADFLNLIPFVLFSAYGIITIIKGA